MRFRRGKSSNKGRKGGSSISASLQNGGEKKIDGGAGGTNSRQIAPETQFGSVDYGSSRDETFFEACPWLDSDCDDEFYSVNGDLTPARSVTSQSSSNLIVVPPGSPKLPTLGAILQAEPLKPPNRKLADLLQESQDDDAEAEDDLSRADSFRAAQEAGRCCVPQVARAAVSCNGRGRRNKDK